MVKQKPNSYVVLQYTGLADSLQCSDACGDGIFYNISQLKAPVDQCFETPKNSMTNIRACSGNPRREVILGQDSFWYEELLFLREELENNSL